MSMDLRKSLFLDHLFAAVSSKRRVLSGFVLGFAASIFVVSVLASINCPATPTSSNASFFSRFFSGYGLFPLRGFNGTAAPLDLGLVAFNEGNSNSSSSSSLSDKNVIFNSCPDSGSTNGSSLTKTFQGNCFQPHSDPGFEKNHQSKPRNSSSSGRAEMDQPLFDKNSTASPISADILKRPAAGNSTARDENATLLAENSTKNSSGKKIQELAASKNNGSSVAKKEVGDLSAKKCDIFDGRWVRDAAKPYYPPGSCPYVDIDFDCYKNGRPDDEFLRWRWQPYGCHIPSLNATDFLERLRDKRILFVGDSLNRNMWESLVCILRHSINNSSKVYEVSGRRQFKMQGYYSFLFEDYNCYVDFVRSPFLVKELYMKKTNGSEDERLRLDLLDETTTAYHHANIVVFNTGHWWTHEKTSSGIDYYQEGNYVYPVLEVMKAYKKALSTWARWVDNNIDPSRTTVVFRGYSLTHFRGGQWNSGGQCHKQTEPIFNETFLAKYPEKMKVFEGVLQQMRTPILYLNISKLTDYRKDGHPSIYRKKYESSAEQIAAEGTQDCSHWCLPGVPDMWNELLYSLLLLDGKL